MACRKAASFSPSYISSVGNFFNYPFLSGSKNTKIWLYIPTR